MIESIFLGCEDVLGSTVTITAECRVCYNLVVISANLSTIGWPAVFLAPKILGWINIKTPNVSLWYCSIACRDADGGFGDA